MSINPEDYIIIKGKETMSFHQNAFRIVKQKFRELENKELTVNLSEVTIEDDNVLYEIKNKEGYKYHADFIIKISINWHYHVEYLRSGVLRHMNTEEIKFVHLQKETSNVMNQVLLSKTKKVYESSEECIVEIGKDHIGQSFERCLADPDRNKTNPESPLLCII